MPQNPQRPFVPHRTPKIARPTIGASEFRLYRPFLPGLQREAIESIASVVASTVSDPQPVVAEPQSAFSAPIRSIQEFLETPPAPAPAYAPVDNENSYANESEHEAFELPPVEHFLDPLPVVEQFAPDSDGALSDAWPTAADVGAPTVRRNADAVEPGWMDTDWQHYDWRAAAALGADAEASNAWASTDWDGTVPTTRDPRPTAAQAIATALDQIAQRIREGELAVPGSALADPTKIAATLAALLGVKR